MLFYFIFANFGKRNEKVASIERRFSGIDFFYFLCPYPSGFIPVCTLGLSQVGRINLGQNVSSLRYFAICGLQEGFEPFAINMKRDTTMWFSKSLPQFVPVPTDHNHIEVISPQQT